MKNVDDNIIAEIIKRLKLKLGRDLTEKEFSVFSQKRSFLAYEMVIDYISDEALSQRDIEEYVKRVVEEK